MIIRTYLTGGAVAAALMLAACHKNEEVATNEVKAAAELNLADTNSNDEMMNEDSGNQAAMNGS